MIVSPIAAEEQWVSGLKQADGYLLEAKNSPPAEFEPTGGTVTLRLHLIEAGGTSKLGMIEVSGSRKRD